MWCICSRYYVKERFMSGITSRVQICKLIPTQIRVDPTSSWNSFSFPVHLCIPTSQPRTRLTLVSYSSSSPISFSFCSSSLSHSLPMHCVPEIHTCCLYPEYHSRRWQYRTSSGSTGTFRRALWRLLVWTQWGAVRLSLVWKKAQLALFSL